jgi:hypothetical protein
MAKKAAVDAVIARLKENWVFSEVIDNFNFSPKATILDRNAVMQPPADNSPWVRVEFPVTTNRQAALGRRYREDGGFRIVVATPIADGIDTSNEWCEQIAALFINENFDDVQCWTPTIREGVDEGSYLIATVVVPYTHHYTA